MSSTTVFPAVAPNSTSLITWELRESSVFELLFVTAGMLCVGGILSMTCCVFYIRKLKIEQSTKRDIFRKAWQEFKGKKMSESSDPGSRRTSVHKKNVNNRRRLASSSRSSSHHVGSAGPTKKRNRALSNVSSLQDLEKGRDISTADEGTQQILDGFVEVLKQGVSLLIQNERKGKFSPVLLRCDDNHQTIFWQKVSRRNKKVKRAGENQEQQLVVETKKTVVRMEDMVVVAAAVNDNDEEVIGEDGGDNSNPNTTRKGSYNQQKMKMFSITTKDGNVQAFLAQNLMERDAIVHGLLLMQDDAQQRQTMYI